MGQGMPIWGDGARVYPRISVTISLWLFAGGIAQVALWPRLPVVSGMFWASYLCLVCALIALLIAVPMGMRRPGLTTLCHCLLPLLIGMGWGLYWDRQALDERLPAALHGSDFQVTVRVTSLPEVRPAAFNFGRPRGVSGNRQDVKFTAEIESSDVATLAGKRVQLAWYATKRAAEIRGGSRWTMRVRLKRPRGSINPHTFDYEAWLLQQRVFATGYIREKDAEPRLLEGGSGILQLRDSLRQRIQASALESGRLVQALLLGDKSGLTDADRALLRSTGTAHLLAISGLHVGMVAGFFLLVGGLLSRLLGLYWPHNPRLPAGLAAVLGAAGYTLICGAPLSAQRALIMTIVALAAWVCRRRVSGGLAFALALALVLLVQPLAVLNAGFWLSFIAVAALLLAFAGRTRSEPGTRAGVYLSGVIRSQWAVLLALLLPSLIFFSGASSSGLLANFFAIPWMGLLILPAIMLGAVLPAGPLGDACWEFADWQLGLLVEVLGGLQLRISGWHWLPSPSWSVAVLAAGSILLLLSPRGFPGRWAGWCLLPAVFAGLLPWRPAEPDSLRVTTLDVGQGLAVAVESGGHHMVLDTGAGSPGGWSAGRSVVAPFLIGEGAVTVDALVVSHGDRDHAGGVAGLAEVIPVSRLIAPGRLSARLAEGVPRPVSAGQCTAGAQIREGDLTVSWLWPRESSALDGEENDHSCVALLEWQGIRVLFTGDISRDVERRLVDLYPEFAPVDLLIVPHHGSRTSTSTALLDWSQPARAVFSAGYRHHFGHPHPTVVQRLLSHGVEVFSTADAGAVQFQWATGTELPRVRCARSSAGFWLTAGPLAGCE